MTFRAWRGRGGLRMPAARLATQWGRPGAHALQAVDDDALARLSGRW